MIYTLTISILTDHFLPYGIYALACGGVGGGTMVAYCCIIACMNYSACLDI